MTPLQKELYKATLSRNVTLLRSIASSEQIGNSKRINLRNIFMELRKIVNHPYLLHGVEPSFDNQELEHQQLIKASAKLQLLDLLLYSLRKRGHRVLIFSQFVQVLDIIEDFLKGEHIPFLRLVIYHILLIIGWTNKN
jgi:chromodomain-helicase-DNA-binding protein 4